MEFDLLADIFSVVESLIKSAALVIAGFWAYRRFIRHREDHPRVQFTVELSFVGLQHNTWLVDLRAKLKNSGLVRHEIRDFTFDLRSIEASKPIDANGPGGRANFRTKLLEGSWLPDGWNYTFVDPGVETHYSFVAAVPASTAFLLLCGRFQYPTADEFHTAEFVIKVPVLPVPEVEAL